MTRRHLIAFVMFTSASVAAAQATATVLEVRETERGTYSVIARFEVEAPSSIVREVLTDYDRIPRFMPDVRSSAVRARYDDVVVVEQEAVSKFMLFSKKVHLLLEVQEGSRVLSFADTSGKSFESYEGSWTIDEHGGATALTYSLAAKPAFSVPDFVIKKLLDRNARKMIDHLRAEVAARARK